MAVTMANKLPSSILRFRYGFSILENSHNHALLVVLSSHLRHIHQFCPTQKSAMATGSLSSVGVPVGDHHPHPPNGQAEHQDPSPTNQGSSCGAQLALPVHIVANMGADPRDDATTTSMTIDTVEEVDSTVASAASPSSQRSQNGREVNDAAGRGDACSYQSAETINPRQVPHQPEYYHQIFWYGWMDGLDGLFRPTDCQVPHYSMTGYLAIVGRWDSNPERHPVHS